MRNLSIGRAFLGLALSFGVVFLGAFAIAWNNPPLPPDTATIGALGAHVSRCLITGVNAGMLALAGWLPGWAIKSTRGGRLTVFAKDQDEDDRPTDRPQAAPINWTAHHAEGVSVKIPPKAQEADVVARLDQIAQRLDRLEKRDA